MYLVTGGGGFVGSHLVRALVQRGTAVRVLDNSSSGSRQRIADVLADVEWIDGDVRDSEAVRRACRGVEVVFHQAAIASVPKSIAEPLVSHDTNVTGTLHVLMAAHEFGVRRVVFASSSAIYGNTPITPKAECLLPQPLSPYGAQKLAAEAYCRVWHSIYGLETVALRYFNIFGPGQTLQSFYTAVIPRSISAVLEGRPPIIYGDGEQSRDFIYISNVVDANLLAAQVPEAAGKLINVGSGKKVTVNQLIAEIGRIVERPVQPSYEAARLGDIRESLADISQLRQVLGYEPGTAFNDGLALTVRAFEGDLLAMRQAMTSLRGTLD